MPEAPTNNSASLALADLKLELETIVPSRVKKRDGDGASLRSAANTLRGLQNRKSTVEPQSLPNGWTRVKHPDSGVYYVHEEKGVCTSLNVPNSKICSSIMEIAETLQSSQAWQALLEDHQGGLNLVLDARDNRTSYYCVSHAERCVFWLEGFEHGAVKIPCSSNKCKKSEDSREHCIKGQYWKHCELFPTTFMVTKDVTSELKNILLQVAADRLLVRFSTSPFEKHDLEHMLNMVKEIEVNIQGGNDHAAWIIAKFMALYNDGMLHSSYCQLNDCFDIDDTGNHYKRHFLLSILALFFLTSPDVYAEELHSFHENFTLTRLSRFVHKVDQSIRDSNLLATVLLTTNVGLLGWSDSGRVGGISSPTSAQIVSCISIIFSVGSITLGLAISKQYRVKGTTTPLRTVAVLKRILEKPFGLEGLAIICSLPHVFLMWGLIAFLLAFSIIFYDHTGIQIPLPISLALFLVVLGHCACIYAAARLSRGQKPQAQSNGNKPASLLQV